MKLSLLKLSVLKWPALVTLAITFGLLAWSWAAQYTYWRTYPWYGRLCTPVPMIDCLQSQPMHAALPEYEDVIATDKTAASMQEFAMYRELHPMLTDLMYEIQSLFYNASAISGARK